MKRGILIMCAAVVAALFSGCSSLEKWTDSDDRATVHYEPQTNVTQVTGADSVRVKVVDVRLVRDRVGEGSLAAPDDFYPIPVKEDVVLVLQKAIEQEATARGFKLADGGPVLEVRLNKFYTIVKTGWWPQMIARANVSLSVRVMSTDGRVTYSKQFDGEGKRNGIDWGTMPGVNGSLDRALSDVLRQLFNDTAFVKALVKTPAA